MSLRIDKSKLRKLSPTKDPFLSLVRSIIYQQISTKAGDSINKRFLALFGLKKPTPKTLLAFNEEKLRSAGLSGQKVKYLRDLSEKFLNKTINPKNFSIMSDTEITEHLTQVKGIGKWTADMFLIFALNRPNILPVGDLGVQKSFQKVFNLRKLPDEKRMRKLAREHDGAHTELALFMWYSIDGR
jgi:DNA-3-methyladenine glycosylase II